jgi:indolepyruvate decarboxylase
MDKVTVAEYLLNRLAELGIKEIIGVPGDYNLDLVEQIEHDHRFTWIGDCNEMNAAYVADGYAKTKGISALVTTYGPGELSAINGIAGAYAENSTVIKIVGAIGLAKERQQLPAHHTLLNRKYRQFVTMYREITVEQAELDFQEPGAKIDQAIKAGYYHKLPVYIRVPQDLLTYKIPAPIAPLDLSLPQSNPTALNQAWDKISKLIRKPNTLLVIGEMVARYKLQPHVNAFLQASGFPYLVMWGAKGTVSEQLPNYLGTYAGVLSKDSVRQQFDDAIQLVCLGVKWWEINLGVYTTKLDPAKVIDIQPESITINGKMELGVTLNDILHKLFASKYQYEGTYPNYNPHTEIDHTTLTVNEIEHANLVYHLNQFVRPMDNIVVDTGTVAFDVGAINLPEGATVTLGSVWASIGFSLPAACGVALAQEQGRTIMLIGDGALQMTVQALSTMFRNALKPIIFLINNDGYTIERGFVRMHSKYNDIKSWDYLNLPATFKGEAVVKSVATDQELSAVLCEIATADKLCLIEIIMDKYKQPPLLQQLTSLSAKV